MPRSFAKPALLLLAFLIQLLILVGCSGSGGGVASTGAQSAKTSSSYGYFRKSNVATGTSANTSVNMSYTRTGHTATLLADGRVLVAGGNNTTIKLYFTSVMLQNGLSLHAGGAGSDGMSTKVELVFDESGHWSSFTGRMIEDRSDYGITMLGTGRVLITGGSNSFGQVSDTAEIYEPNARFYITIPHPVLALGESVQLAPQPSVTVKWSAKLGTVNAAGLYTAPGVATWQAKGTAPFDEVTAMASDGSHATARIQLLAP